MKSARESPPLPVDHPDFRYPESRNPYWKKLKDVPGRVFLDNATEAHRGRWREAFPDGREPSKRELHVEIGCNAGHVVLEWASSRPEAAYIGLDWKFKQVHRGAEKAVKRGIRNLLFFRAHAERIQFMFGPGEIDFLYLYFPDPWPKKSQWKNRYVTPARLRALHAILRPGGVFHIKTDHAGYFEWMEAALAELPGLWEVIERTQDLHGGNPRAKELEVPEVTLFERIFVRKGVRINSLRLRRV